MESQFLGKKNMVKKMEIEFKDNTAEFEINFEFYDFPSLLESAKEFTETCWISFLDGDECKSLHVRIEPKDNDVSVRDAVYSFLNYTLGIIHGKMKESQDG